MTPDSARDFFWSFVQAAQRLQLSPVLDVSGLIESMGVERVLRPYFVKNILNVVLRHRRALDILQGA